MTITAFVALLRNILATEWNSCQHVLIFLFLPILSLHVINILIVIIIIIIIIIIMMMMMMMRLARSCRHLPIPCLTDCGWCELYARYWSVCVGSCIHLCVVYRAVLLLRVRKATLLSFSVSMVKRIDGCCWLRCLRKLSTLFFFVMVNVSST